MNKEQIYDKQIAPLMNEIIRICKEHKIAVLATYYIPTEDEPSLECTTALLSDDFNPHPKLIEALRVIRPQEADRMMMLTTRDANGNVTRMDAIL